ncbi:MAG: hypothetical protein Q8916_07985, partial [Bacteroidota bacterium]|nr:hypothetical protein [Bacteroidota bacterium]
YDDSPTPPASWTSTQPFMLVQYVCSSTHDAPNAGNRNLGDPAMVVINATAQFRKDLFFQTPTIDEASGQKDFTNYLNIILPTSHESATTFDGHRLSDSIPGTKLKERFPIANTGWEGMRLTFSIGTGEGSHHLISDTAIGAYVYGYGTDDSYAWSANLGVVTINSPDTVAPMATVTGSCLCSHISVRDVGSVQSKISAIYTDSIFNVAYTIDTNFVAGAETDSSYFDLCVLDPSKEGFVSVSIYDVAGNKTMITSAYKPYLVAFSPAVLDFGFVGPGASAALYDTICNIGETPYHIAAADLTLAGGGLSDAMGLSIDSLGADGDLAVGECRVIKVRYAPSTSLSLKDTIFIADSCLKFACPVKSIGSVPDFSLSDFDFKCVDIGTTKTLTATIATNLSTIPLTIDSIWVDDTLHFGYDPTAPSQNNLPFTLPAHGQHSVQCSFKPDTVGPFSTTIHFRSTEVGARTATLLGCGQLPAAVGGSGYASSLSSGSPEYISVSAQLDRGSDLVLLPPIPNPVTKDKKTIRFIYGCKFDSPVDLAIFDILGNRIANVVGDGYQAAGIYEADFAPGWALPAGDYLYRLSASGKVISGKLVITR